MTTNRRNSSFPTSEPFFVSLPVTLRVGNLHHWNASLSFRPHKPISNVHLQSPDSRSTPHTSGTSLLNSLPSLRIATMSQRPVTSRARGVYAFYTAAWACVHGDSCKSLHGENATYSLHDKNKTCTLFLAGMFDFRLSILQLLTAQRCL